MTKGTEALLMWCKKNTEGYRDVLVKDFHLSWRDGLAFCALIHKYRPDVIPYNTLKKENCEHNLNLAFTVGEKIGIPSLLEVEDMLIVPRPDTFSVITYLSQYYHFFMRPENSKTMGSGVASIGTKEAAAATAPAPKVEIDVNAEYARIARENDRIQKENERRMEENEKIRKENKRRSTINEKRLRDWHEQRKSNSPAQAGGATSSGVATKGSLGQCVACNKDLSGSIVEFAQKSMFHEACFKCHSCSRAFATNPQGQIQALAVDGWPYCERCGKIAFVKSRAKPTPTSPGLIIEEEKKKKDDEERKRKAEDERLDEEKKRTEERRKHEEERKRKEEEDRRKQEEDRKRKQEEDRKRQEEERKRQEDERKRQEDERKRQDDERKKQEEERKRAEDKRKQEEETRKKQEEDRKRQDEERKKQEDRRKAEEEQRRRQEEEQRKKQEEEARKKEEARRREEEDRIKREQDVAKREALRKESEERRKREEEERKKAEEERKKKEGEDRKRREELEKKAAEEERKRREEEDKKRLEEDKRKREAETEKKRKEEDERKRKEEEDRKKLGTPVPAANSLKPAPYSGARPATAHAQTTTSQSASASEKDEKFKRLTSMFDNPQAPPPVPFPELVKKDNRKTPLPSTLQPVNSAASTSTATSSRPYTAPNRPLEKPTSPAPPAPAPGSKTFVSPAPSPAPSPASTPSSGSKTFTPTPSSGSKTFTPSHATSTTTPTPGSKTFTPSHTTPASNTTPASGSKTFNFTSPSSVATTYGNKGATPSSTPTSNSTTTHTPSSGSKTFVTPTHTSTTGSKTFTPSHTTPTHTPTSGSKTFTPSHTPTNTTTTTPNKTFATPTKPLTPAPAAVAQAQDRNLEVKEAPAPSISPSFEVKPTPTTIFVHPRPTTALPRGTAQTSQHRVAKTHNASAPEKGKASVSEKGKDESAEEKLKRMAEERAKRFRESEERAKKAQEDRERKAKEERDKKSQEDSKKARELKPVYEQHNTILEPVETTVVITPPLKSNKEKVKPLPPPPEESLTPATHVTLQTTLTPTSAPLERPSSPSPNRRRDGNPMIDRTTKGISMTNIHQLQVNTGQHEIGVAEYDFTAEEENELTFLVGDKIELLCEHGETEWAEGRNARTGHVGFFLPELTTLHKGETSRILRESMSVAVISQGPELLPLLEETSVLDFNFIPNYNGYLNKQAGKLIKKWKRRWFSLQEDQIVYYLEEQEKFMTGRESPPKGMIYLRVVKSVDAYSDQRLAIHTPERTYWLQADTDEMRDRWIFFINMVLKRLKAAQAKGDRKPQKKEGYLTKLSRLHTWNRRWLVLQGGVLCWYKAPGHSQHGKVPLYHAILEEYKPDEKSCAFVVTSPTDNSSAVFQAESDEVVAQCYHIPKDHHRRKD